MVAATGTASGKMTGGAVDSAVVLVPVVEATGSACAARPTTGAVVAGEVTCDLVVEVRGGCVRFGGTGFFAGALGRTVGALEGTEVA